MSAVALSRRSPRDSSAPTPLPSARAPRSSPLPLLQFSRTRRPLPTPASPVRIAVDAVTPVDVCGGPARQMHDVVRRRRCCREVWRSSSVGSVLSVAKTGRRCVCSGPRSRRCTMLYHGQPLLFHRRTLEGGLWRVRRLLLPAHLTHIVIITSSINISTSIDVEAPAHASATRRLGQQTLRRSRRRCCVTWRSAPARATGPTSQT